MKKITALLLALLLALSLCTMGAAADETVTIVLEPADDTLLTAEGLALFFVDRAAVKEETETSVSWYKETTANGQDRTRAHRGDAARHPPRQRRHGDAHFRRGRL